MPETKTIKPVVSEERQREIVAEGADELDPKALAAAEQVYTETSVYPIVPANHDAALAQAIRAYLRAALRRSTETDKPGLREMAEALRPFAEAFAKANDPGVSDLYDEQPFSLHVPLGAWRRARSVWCRFEPLPRSTTGGAK